MNEVSQCEPFLCTPTQLLFNDRTKLNAQVVAIEPLLPQRINCAIHIIPAHTRVHIQYEWVGTNWPGGSHTYIPQTICLRLCPVSLNDEAHSVLRSLRRVWDPAGVQVALLSTVCIVQYNASPLSERFDSPLLP